MCRGNFRSAWFSEGGYDFVAEAVFGGLDVDAFFLEYDALTADQQRAKLELVVETAEELWG